MALISQDDHLTAGASATVVIVYQRRSTSVSLETYPLYWNTQIPLLCFYPQLHNVTLAIDLMRDSGLKFYAKPEGMDKL